MALSFEGGLSLALGRCVTLLLLPDGVWAWRIGVCLWLRLCHCEEDQAAVAAAPVEAW